MEITNSIARYSMAMAAARVADQVNVSMMKNVMELQQDTMSQLLASMGVGGAFSVQG